MQNQNSPNLTDTSMFHKELKLLLDKYGFSTHNLTSVNVIISQKNNNLPAIFLRKNTTNPDTIKTLIRAAYHNQPIIILPQFTNVIKSLGTAVSKGILYRDNGNNRTGYGDPACKHDRARV